MSSATGRLASVDKIHRFCFGTPEPLHEVPLESSRQALELLFRLEGEFELVPDEIDGELVLKIGKKAENPRNSPKHSKLGST